MVEVGIDLSTHQVKSLDAVQHRPFDYVVTVCRDAHETCPVFPGRARIVHHGFDDPPRLAATAKSSEEAMRHYAGERFEVLSAGVAPTEVHALTRQVLTDIGLDPSGLYAKSLDDFFARVSIAYAIIVCDQAEDGCPRLFPFALQTLHWPFDAPTQAEGSTMERLCTFRTVRDQIERRIRARLASLEGI